ncbi:hypothetical protein BHM03_00058316 [Ensete ventricosum]|nr:hypothetical protein BHM03_00058316 [Ensete ventricosum]
MDSDNHRPRRHLEVGLGRAYRPSERWSPGRETSRSPGLEPFPKVLITYIRSPSGPTTQLLQLSVWYEPRVRLNSCVEAGRHSKFRRSNGSDRNCRASRHAAGSGVQQTERARFPTG